MFGEGGWGGLPFISGDCGGDKEKGARAGQTGAGGAGALGWAGTLGGGHAGLVDCRIPEALVS